MKFRGANWDVGGFATAEDLLDARDACEGHADDILRAHGIGARWATHNIPAERASRICGHYAPDRSLIGSAADLCTTADGSGW